MSRSLNFEDRGMMKTFDCVYFSMSTAERAFEMALVYYFHLVPSVSRATTVSKSTWQYQKKNFDIASDHEFLVKMNWSTF